MPRQSNTFVLSSTWSLLQDHETSAEMRVPGAVGAEAPLSTPHCLHVRCLRVTPMQGPERNTYKCWLLLPVTAKAAAARLSHVWDRN